MTSFADSSERARPEAVPGRVWRGTALQVLGRVWSAACTLTYLWLAAHRLDQRAFDAFTFWLAAFLWLDAFVVLGTGQALIQRTAADPAALGPVVRSVRRVRVASGLAGLILVSSGAFLAGEPGWGWIALAAAYPITHALEVSTAVWQNRIAWGRPVAIRAVASGLSLGLVALVAHAGASSAGAFLVAVAAGSATGNVLLHCAARREIPAGTQRAPLGDLLRLALPLGLSGLCAQTYFYVDNLFVRAWTGEGQLGRYNVAVRFMSFFLMVAQYASTAALPWYARRHAAAGLDRAVARIGPPLFAAACLAAGALWPWTGELLELFRPGFGSAAGALRWLLGATVAVYAGSVLVTAVVATGDAGAMLVISSGALALNLVANAWAVPRFGIEGAAATTCATEVAVAAGGWIALARGHAAPPARTLWRWAGGLALFPLAAALSAQLRGSA